MASTTTTIRGVPPTSLTMNMFGSPAVKSENPAMIPSLIEEKIVSSLQTAKDDDNDSSSPQNFYSDDEDIFNLDMVTMDMDFEQAYSMYSQAQQKNALQEVEALREAQQQLGMNPTLASRSSHTQLDNKQFKDTHNQHKQHNSGKTAASHHFGVSDHPLDESIQQLSQFDFHQSQHRFANPHTQAHALPQGKDMVGPHEKLNMSTVSDQFFSHTESNALEKFLDNLAYSSQVNPLELYNQAEQSKFHQPYNMHTMPMAQPQPFASSCEFSESLKRDLTDAFKHPPSQSLKSFGHENGFANGQLPTPPEKRDESKRSHASISPSPEAGSEKKRRRSAKPLLSSEQKRLNHSYSEQKRRMLCKEAYERCLLLVTNVDDYKNELVSACPLASSKKKSKRKQLTKDGLPNLSKHTALYMICEEIIKIQGKNNELKELLKQHS